MRLKVFLFVILAVLIMGDAMAVQVVNTSNIEPTHAHNEVFLERNSSGTIFLLYIDNVTSGADVSDVYLAYSNNNGTTWTSGINISNSRKVIDYPSYSLFLRNNTFYLIYVENSSTTRNLTLKTCNSDCTIASNWVNKTTIFQGNVERPELKTDSSGNFHAVFENYSTSSYGNIVYTRCGNTSNCFQGGNWSSPVKISNLADYYGLQPDLNIDSNNNLHIMWMDKLNNTQWDIFYSTCAVNANCTNSGNWSYANVTNRAAGDDDVVFVIDSNNAIHTTYDDNDGEVVYVNCSSNCTNSSRWSSPVNVSNSRPIKPGHSTISIDASNNLYVLWHTEEIAMPSADAGRIQYRRYNAQTFSWSAVQNITTDNTHRYVTARPSTTFGNSERLDYAWQNGTSAPYMVLFNSVIADVAAPTVSLNSPSNDYSTTSLNFNFSFNVTDANDIANCSLIVNNAIVGYNSSYVNKSGENNISYTFSSTGSYTWQINCTDVVNNIGNSSSRSLTISSSASPPSQSSGGGGGGASTTCYPRWVCTSWNYCINNTETRECIDANKCSSKTKPETTRNCTEIMPEVQTGGIPAGAVLVEEKKSSSSMLKPVSCTKQDKSRISIIRQFNVYEVKKADSIEYKSVISLTIENTGEEEATNIEIKEIIPEIMLKEPSLTFSVEGITLKGNTIRYNIQHLNAKEKAYLNYSVNARIDGSVIQTRPVTGFSIIDARFNPFTFISGIPSFIFKIVWSLLSIAFFLSLAISAIHWIRYGNIDTKAWKLSIILVLPIIMSIFDFALANYLIVLAVVPIAVVEMFVWVRKRRG